jgi:uncharacterized Zn-binding protein involved in type VI secretion
VNVEPFLLQQAQPGLVPGEAVLGCALLREPTRFNVLGVPTVYDDFLAVATDRRLVVFQTVTSGLLVSNVAQPVAHSPVVWSYDELASVVLGQVEGIVAHSGGAATTLTLTSIPGFGPTPTGNTSQPGRTVRYDVYAAIENVPGQGAFMRSFPTWLKERFEAGAFALTDARRAELEASIPALRNAARVAADRARAASAADGKRLVRGLVTFAIVVAMLIVAGAGAVMALGAHQRVRFAERDRDRLRIQKADLVWMRAGARPPAGCPEKDLDLLWGVCHSCRVSRPGTPMAPGWRVVEGHARGKLECPPLAELETETAELAQSAKRSASRAEGAEEERIAGIAIAATGLLGGALALVLRARGHRRRAESAASR